MGAPPCRSFFEDQNYQWGIFGPKLTDSSYFKDGIIVSWTMMINDWSTKIVVFETKKKQTVTANILRRGASHSSDQWAAWKALGKSRWIEGKWNDGAVTSWTCMISISKHTVLTPKEYNNRTLKYFWTFLEVTIFQSPLAIWSPGFKHPIFCFSFPIHFHPFLWIHQNVIFCTSSTAQGGGGSFKNRKPIGAVGCCDSEMAERNHCWTERRLISLTLVYLSIYLSVWLSTCLSLVQCHSV